MADISHRHGQPGCTLTKHHKSCPTNGWSFVCGPTIKGKHTCIHLDPNAPGKARVLKLVKSLGLAVRKGHKMKAAPKKRTAVRRARPRARSKSRRSARRR